MSQFKAVSHDSSIAAREHHTSELMRHVLGISKFAVFLVFVFTPTITSRVVSLFNCQLYDHKMPYLLSNPDTPCFGPVYKYYSGIAIMLIIIYPIGVPIVMFVLMYSQQHRRRDAGFKAVFGFLYEEVRISAYSTAFMSHMISATCF
jgi:hypothetical protein